MLARLLIRPYGRGRDGPGFAAVRAVKPGDPAPAGHPGIEAGTKPNRRMNLPPPRAAAVTCVTCFRCDADHRQASPGAPIMWISNQRPPLARSRPRTPEDTQ